MKTNFYILVIVAINQIFSFQSSSGDFTVQLEDDENSKVKEKAKQVAQTLALSGINTMPAESKTTGKKIKECYDENIENYEIMINFLNDQITDAGETLRKAVGRKYSERIEAAEEQLTNVARDLKEYTKSLSNELKVLAKAIKRIRSKNFALKKYLEGYYVALRDIEKKENGKANEALNAYKFVLEQILSTCENTVNQIRTCLGETDPFIPIKHIDNRN